MASSTALDTTTNTTPKAVANTRGSTPRNPRASRSTADSLEPLTYSLLLAMFLALTFLLGVFPVKDTDIWWHLKAGGWIRSQGMVPQTDLFTFGAEGNRWTDLHWLFQVLSSLVHEQFGMRGLNLAKCLLTTLAMLLLITARRSGWPLWLMVLVWTPALLVLGGRMYVRPETLTFLYLSIFLAVLFRIQEHPRLAYWLPLTQILWVNSQGLFVFGPFLFGTAILSHALTRSGARMRNPAWWRTILQAFGLTLLACLINPYGLLGALYPFELLSTMSSPLFSESIAELTPIPQLIQDFGFAPLPEDRTRALVRILGDYPDYPLPLQLHLATIVVGCLSFLIPAAWVGSKTAAKLAGGVDRAGVVPPSESRKKSPRKSESGDGSRVKKRDNPGSKPERLDPLAAPWLRVFKLVLFVTFSFLSWRATRNSHQFAAVVGTVTAWNFAEWWARSGLASSRTARAACQLGVAVVVTLVFVLVGSGTFYRWAGEDRTVGLGEEPLWFAHDAVKSLAGPDAPSRSLAFHLGQAAVYEYHLGPEKKTYADARLEVMGTQLYEQYLSLSRRLSTSGEQDSALREVENLGGPAVIVDHGTFASIAASMMGQSRWKCSWFDPIASVYVPSSSRLTEVDFGRRHFQGGDDSSGGRLEGVAAELAACKAVNNVSVALWERGKVGQVRPMATWAVGLARRAIATAPDLAAAWSRLGLVLSIREPSTIPDPRPRFRLPHDPIQDLTPLRAITALTRANSLEPGNYYVQSTLATLFFDRRMDAPARDFLEKLLKSRPFSDRQRLSQELFRERLRASEQRLAREVPGTWSNATEFTQVLNSLLEAGRVEEAALLMEKHLPPTALSDEQTELLGMLWLNLGRPDRASRVWGEAARKQDDGRWLARQGLSAFVANDFETARGLYQSALSKQPGLFDAAYELAVLEQDAGNAEAAARWARRAGESAPTDFARAASASLAEWTGRYASQAQPASADARKK